MFIYIKDNAKKKADIKELYNKLKSLVYSAFQNIDTKILFACLVA